jgi:predicted nucleotidyltransferase
MVSSAALLLIREARHARRLAQLEEGVRTVAQAAEARSCRVLLFGSLARNDWDGLSDVDLLVIAERRSDAEDLADALVQACLADDVLALDRTTWERRCASSPYWQAIAREACPLLETRR